MPEVNLSEMAAAISCDLASGQEQRVIVAARALVGSIHRRGQRIDVHIQSLLELQAAVEALGPIEGYGEPCDDRR